MESVRIAPLELTMMLLPILAKRLKRFVIAIRLKMPMEIVSIVDTMRLLTKINVFVFLATKK